MDQMDRIERNTPQDDRGVIPQFDVGNVVDPVDANHDQRARMSFDANSLTTTWNASQCHAQYCYTTLPQVKPSSPALRQLHAGAGRQSAEHGQLAFRRPRMWCWLAASSICRALCEPSRPRILNSMSRTFW